MIAISSIARIVRFTRPACRNCKEKSDNISGYSILYTVLATVEDLPRYARRKDRVEQKGKERF